MARFSGWRLAIVLAAIGLSSSGAAAQYRGPTEYKSPYGIKETSAQSCQKSFVALLGTIAAKTSASASVTNSCRLAEIMADITADQLRFDNQCPNFPGAAEAATVNRANLERLRKECQGGPKAPQGPLPEQIVDYRNSPSNAFGNCALPIRKSDGTERPPTRDEQKECFLKLRRGN